MKKICPPLVLCLTIALFMLGEMRAVGQCTLCSGSQNIQIGLGTAGGSSSYAFGNATSAGDYAWSIGSKVFGTGDNSFVIGQEAVADMSNSFNYIFGSGIEDYPLLNNVNNSIMFGIGSDKSTVLVGGASGAGTWGNVGIGNITAPASLLHVRDQLRVGFASTANGSVIFNNNTNSNTVTVQSGTTSSSYTLTLPTAQAAGSSYALVNDGNGNLSWAAPGSVGSAWMLAGNAGTNPASDFVGTQDNTDLVFRTNNVEKARIASGGYVGIGTTAPTSLLHLKGAAASTSSPAVQIEKGSGGIGRLLIRTGNDSITMAQDNNEHMSLTNWRSDKDIIFNVNDGGTMTEALHIEGSTGNVGVGVNFPNAKLHVEMQDPTDPNLARYSVSGASGSFTFTNSGTTTDMGPTMAGNASVNTLPALLFFARATATDSGTEPIMTFDSRLNTGAVSVRPLFSWENSTTARMTMLADGNLGIGTTTPAEKLHVAGKVRVNTFDPGPGTPVHFLANGNLADNGSSERFKENIESLEFDKGSFLSMNPVSYNWKPVYGGSWDVGFIAQQVAEVFPDLADIRYKHTIADDGVILRDTLGLPVVDSTQTEPYGVKYHKIPVYLYILARQQDSLIQAMAQRMDDMQAMLDNCCSQPSYRMGDNGMEQVNELRPDKDRTEFVLLQNDPNPFSDFTDIRLSLPSTAKNASLLVVDMKGTVMLNVPLSGGQEKVRVYSSDIGKGIFTYYLMNEGNVVASRKMVSSK